MKDGDLGKKNRCQKSLTFSIDTDMDKLAFANWVFGSLWQSSAGSRLVGTGSGLGRDWDVGPDEG